VAVEIAIRPEKPCDAPAISAVHRASFPTDLEARLVDALRDAGRLSISLVAVSDAAVVGHIAFSPVTVASGSAGVGLGPIAVIESNRRQGVGARLVERGLDECRKAGHGWAVVLGDPAYYARFGFQTASAFGFSDEFHGGDAFQALEIIPGTMPSEAGLVRYAAEFSALE
jgi:putative acetyltransferase